MTDDARTLLSENIIGTLATVNADGSPWASPVHTFFDNEAMYWFSYTEKQHSQNIERDPRVSLVIFSPDLMKGPKGVYINGTAEKLDELKTVEAKQLMVDRIGKIVPAFEKATAYRLPFGKFNSGRSTGNCWYFYT